MIGNRGRPQRCSEPDHAFSDRRSIPRTHPCDCPVLAPRHVEGLVSLTGDDAEQLLPMVTKVLVEALLQLVSRDELERQLDAWLDERRTRLAG
jgi:molybdopterin-guanine dinucleotide biosynthesis protein A